MSKTLLLVFSSALYSLSLQEKIMRPRASSPQITLLYFHNSFLSNFLTGKLRKEFRFLKSSLSEFQKNYPAVDSWNKAQGYVFYSNGILITSITSSLSPETWQQIKLQLKRYRKFISTRQNKHEKLYWARQAYLSNRKDLCLKYLQNTYNDSASILRKLCKS